MTLAIKFIPGLQPYTEIWQQMRELTLKRSLQSQDEIWCLQHHPVFTQGQAGKDEHIINPGNIPVIKTDRGGQVTYHGPGQLVIYFLLNLKNYNFSIREFVTFLENSIIDFLEHEYNLKATNDINARGVYVNNAKICSIGLRVRKGFSYHGISLNVDMDLEPFTRINPCGYKGLQIAQLKDFTEQVSIDKVRNKLLSYFKF